MAQIVHRHKPADESVHSLSMRFSPQLLDEIRARLSVSHVVSRKVALKRAGREYRGLSPFKVEKTPSFFVNDQKGFYHCFASGEHGDIFTFLMTTEGLSFPEAVERLAAEAGVALPAPTTVDRAKDDQRTRLLALLEQAAAFFEAKLASREGTDARLYLDRRGLTTETVGQFRIGFAPASSTALTQHLTNQGFLRAEMITSGMLVGGDDIPQPYDRFRNRVMFPITDLKGRVIAFGGRALEPGERAKYLNSPETPLFHKGAILFNAAKARPLAFARERVIVVEGYMDVVALTQAGFGDSVAPLGTALTEQQVQMVWRMVHEPILCFDGDDAGTRAAHRAIDTMLPHLKPGLSARFVFLPGGSDPDDLIRQEGPQAMQTALERAQPLAEVLWQRELAAGDWSTPERRAHLERRLTEIVNGIADLSVRSHYRAAMREKLFLQFGSRRPQRGAQRPPSAAPSRNFAGVPGAQQARPSGNQPQPWAESRSVGASQSLRRQLLENQMGRPPYREALIIRTLINHPWLLDHDAERIAALDFTSEAMARIRNALLDVMSDNDSLDSERIQSHLDKLSLSKVVNLVERAITHRSDSFAEPDADHDEVARGWNHTLKLHDRHTSLRQALTAAQRAWDEEGSEIALARIIEIQRQLSNSESLELPTDA